MVIKRHLNLDRYNFILVDLWGVIFDGSQLYPRIREVLIDLQLKKKKVIFFSNSPHSKNDIIDMLEKLNIGIDLYQEIISSGELVRDYLQNNKSLGCKYFHIGSYCKILDELSSYKRVEKIKNADFSIITSSLNCYSKCLVSAKESARYGIPLVCSNSDKISINNSGDISYCPGIIAEIYQKMGGNVIYFGKPYKNIYDYAIKLTGLIIDKTLAIGDSMHQDILGACSMGIDSLLICSGIHRHELQINLGENASEENIRKLIAKYSVLPKYVISSMDKLILH